MEQLARDLRYALRSLLRARMMTVASLLSLTLGIATTTTVFSILDAALLRPAPFADSERLAILQITHATPAEGEHRERWSWPRFQLLRQTLRSFTVASFSNAVLTITGVEDPEPLSAEFVSAEYLSVLRVRPAVGRGFAADEDDPRRPKPVVVLGYDLWRRRYNSDTRIAGRVVQLNGVNVTVIGVAPEAFAGLSGRAQAWLPAPIAALATYRDYLVTNQNFISVVGRLSDSVPPDRALAELQLVGQQIHAILPSASDTPSDQFAATFVPLNQARVDPVTRRGLSLLFGAVGLLLLIACANVASLLLGRATSRRREVAIRLAIGATRGRLVRMLLTESVILATAAGVLGALIAAWAVELVQIPTSLSSGRNFYGAVGEFATPVVDARVLLFAIGLCVITVLLFGLVPAFRAAHADLVTDLKSGAPGWRAFGRRLVLRELVVSVEVALAVVLLVGGGLMLTSYRRIRDTALGFDPTHLLTFSIRPSEVEYPPAAAPALIDRVLAEVARVPGVVSATVDACAPLSTICANGLLHIVGRPRVSSTDAPSVMRHYVGPDHFRTLGIPVIRGRAFTAADRAGRPHVTIINEAASRRFWPDEDPIGKRAWFDGSAAFAHPDSAAEIVGIVRDVAYQPLDQNPVRPDFFTPYAQFTYATRMVLVKTRDEPTALTPAIARAVRRADPSLALFDVQSMETRAGSSWAKHTFQTWLLDAFAAIALFLAATGIYAVTAHFVASRTKELGVRIALGATPADVVRASTAHTVRLGLLGLIVGLAGAIGAARVLQALLYDTSPLDVGVFITVGLTLLVVMCVASYIPVRRALGVSPIDSLRSE